MSSGLSFPQVNETDLNIGLENQVNDLLEKSCKVYISKGSFAESDIPDTKAELKDLYDNDTPGENKFAYFGNMDESGSNVNSTPNMKKIDFYEVQVSTDVTATLVSVTVNEAMLNFLATQSGVYSLLFVPEEIDNLFFAISGATLNYEFALQIVGTDLSKINIKATRRVNDIRTVLKLKKVSD